MFMEINTKFNLGNKIFFMNNNKVCEGTIVRISILVEENTTEIRYRVKVGFSYKSLLESKVFATKQELLNTL